MKKARLDDLARMVRFLGRPVAERRPKAVRGDLDESVEDDL